MSPWVRWLGGRRPRRKNWRSRRRGRIFCRRRLDAKWGSRRVGSSQELTKWLVVLQNLTHSIIFQPLGLLSINNKVNNNNDNNNNNNNDNNNNKNNSNKSINKSKFIRIIIMIMIKVLHLLNNFDLQVRRLYILTLSLIPKLKNHF